MILSAKKEIAILNDLLEGVVTSGRGYRLAAEGSDANVRSLFERHATERRNLAAEMRLELRRLGGTPVGDDAGTVPTRRGKVSFVESMEAQLRLKFERALGAGGLSAPVLVLLARAYIAIRAGHDQIRNIKRRCEAMG